MPMPTSVRNREVIFGAGYAAAVWCATRVESGKPPPIVFEQNLALGGMFAQLVNFRLNSQNNASVASVASPGPSRVVPFAGIDDLNWIPGSPHQARQYGASEYPPSEDMCRAIARTVKDYAEVYTGAKGLTFNRNGQVRLADGTLLGTARRIIWAAGTVPRTGFASCPAVMSGYDFLRSPPRELHDRQIAVVGSGNTAAQCVEYMVGQGLVYPATPPGEIHWYGDTAMPLSKSVWADRYSARYSGLARHFPQQQATERSVIRPYPARGTMVPLGRTAMVNGQVYDMVVMATGFRSAPCPARVSSPYRIGDMTVAKCNSDDTIDGVPTVFSIGTAAALTASYEPYRSRFPETTQAMFNQGPRIAALAAALPG